MPSRKQAPTARSAAVLFSAEQRSAPLGDPSVTEKTMTWAAVPATASDCWPELALAAWAFAGT